MIRKGPATGKGPILAMLGAGDLGLERPEYADDSLKADARSIAVAALKGRRTLNCGRGLERPAHADWA